MHDLLALSSDYNATDKATLMLFAETQNKLLYADLAAAEFITQFADANAPKYESALMKGTRCAQGRGLLSNEIVHSVLSIT